MTAIIISRSNAKQSLSTLSRSRQPLKRSFGIKFFETLSQLLRGRNYNTGEPPGILQEVRRDLNKDGEKWRRGEEMMKKE